MIIISENNRIIRIDKRSDGVLLRDYLRKELKCSRRLVTDMKNDETGMLLNGSKVTVRAVLHEGDLLSLALLDDTGSENIVPTDMELDIVYEDDDVLVINKPYGIPTHPSHNHYSDSLANGVAGYFEKKGKPFVFRALTRLDKDTSGLVLIAKNKLSAFDLSKQLSDRNILKRYLAIVFSDPGEKGVIDAPIRRKAESIIERIVSEDGKEAVTEYERIGKGKTYSLVSVYPKTGRTHQIRVHMAHIGCPILGDTLYGDKNGSELIFRQALHCCSLTFVHPTKNEEITVSTGLPADMQKVAETEGLL